MAQSSGIIVRLVRRGPANQSSRISLHSHDYLSHYAMTALLTSIRKTVSSVVSCKVAGSYQILIMVLILLLGLREIKQKLSSGSHYKELNERWKVDVRWNKKIMPISVINIFKCMQRDKLFRGFLACNSNEIGKNE